MPTAKTKRTGKAKHTHPREASAIAPREDSRIWQVALTLALTVVGVYWRVLGNQFIDFDDGPYIFTNDHVRAGLTLDSLRWAFTSTGGFYWQPVTWLSHMLDVEWFGLNASAHHFVNVLWHALNAALLLVLLARMTGHLWRSTVVAALFALHPLRVESVAWAAERKDVLSAFFFLCTLFAYVSYARLPSWRRYLVVAALFSLALMAKPSVVTAPFVFLLLDYWPLARKERLTLLLREKAPFLLLAAGASVATYLGQKQAGATEVMENLSISDRMANALVAYAHYLGKTFWPHPLAILYPHPQHLSALPVILSFLLLTAITAVAVALGRKLRYLPVGWLWFLGTLVPMIGIIQVGYVASADRFTYIPSIGLFIGMVWLAVDIFERRRWSLAVPIAAAAILSALAFATWAQLPYWRDDQTVWQHAVDSTPNNWMALYKYGKDLADRGLDKEAVPRLEEALRVQPDFYAAWYVLGKEQVAEGASGPAIQSFSEAVRFKPDYADAYLGRARALMNTGDIRAAALNFRQALQYGLSAEWAADAHHGLGVTFAQQHDLQAATDEFQQAVLLRPDLEEAQRNLAQALIDQGRIAEAISRLQQALSATHGSAAIRKMLDDLQAPR